MKKLSNILIGIALVALGCVFAYNAAFDPDINVFFDGWWTLFIIVPSVYGLIRGKEIKTNAIGLVIGVVLFLAARGIIDFDLVWKLLLPAALIFVGVSIIFKDRFKTKINAEIKAINEKNKETNRENRDHVAIFSGLDLNCGGAEFYGNNMTAVFGGIECDIRDAIINEDVVINASAIFGGVDIIIPSDVNVKINSTSIFGGTSKCKRPKIENAPTVYINATSIFGGVDVK